MLFSVFVDVGGGLVWYIFFRGVVFFFLVLGSGCCVCWVYLEFKRFGVKYNFNWLWRSVNFNWYGCVSLWVLWGCMRERVYVE